MSLVVRDPNNSNPRRSTLDTHTEQIELVNKKKKKKKFGRKRHRSDDSEEVRLKVSIISIVV